jgi:choline dehydrogenase-like flavoprotein
MGAYTPIGQGSGVWHGHTDEMERNGRHQGEADSRSSNSPCLAWPAPKVLMQSGIGDQTTLQRLGIPVLQHLPGVSRHRLNDVAGQCTDIGAAMAPNLRLVVDAAEAHPREFPVIFKGENVRAGAVTHFCDRVAIVSGRRSPSLLRSLNHPLRR